MGFRSPSCGSSTYWCSHQGEVNGPHQSRLFFDEFPDNFHAFYVPRLWLVGVSSCVNWTLFHVCGMPNSKNEHFGSQVTSTGIAGFSKYFKIPLIGKHLHTRALDIRYLFVALNFFIWNARKSSDCSSSCSKVFQQISKIECASTRCSSVRAARWNKILRFNTFSTYKFCRTKIK